MHSVFLGKSGAQISCMGLGTIYFGTKVDEHTSFLLLDRYTQSGGSFLDSANKYASWVPGFPYGDILRSLKKEIIISECEKSLKRLGTETIDLYFAHAYDIETPAEETMEAFHHLKKEGKIRFTGASNYYAWQLSEAIAVAKFMADPIWWFYLFWGAKFLNEKFGVNLKQIGNEI